MSKPLDKNFSLNYELDQLPGCCGIWEMYQFYWYNGLDWDDYNNYPGQRHCNAEARRVKREIFKTAKCAICTICDNNEKGRTLLKAFLKVGWREDRKVKSNHGRYFIHLLSIQRRKK